MRAYNWRLMGILTGIIGIGALLGGIYAQTYRECITMPFGNCLAYRYPYSDWASPLIIVGIVGIFVALVSLIQESTERRHEGRAMTSTHSSGAAAEQSRYCSNCGRQLKTDAKFCPACGKAQ